MDKKIKLELHCLPDGTVWLNFWDSMHGNDVVAQYAGGDTLVIDDKECGIGEFINRVEAACI